MYAVLRYKKIDFEPVFVNPLTNEQLAFSGSRQVPALSVDGDLRRESTALCLWLNQLFPDYPLLPGEPAEQAAIDAICHWVDHRLIFVNFLAINRLRNPLKLCIIGWRLGSVVRATSGIKYWQKWLWPLVLKKAAFIRRMVAASDWQGSVSELAQANRQQLAEYLEKGDYLGGFSTPTIADLCAFGPLAHGHMLGSPMVDYYREEATVDAWFIRMSRHFDATFGLFPKPYRQRELPA